MKNWMYYLARHYECQRNHYPDDKLLVLYDIDGTILDMRYTMHCLLKSYDEKYDTCYFEELHITDITFHEDDIVDGLKSMQSCTGTGKIAGHVVPSRSQPAVRLIADIFPKVIIECPVDFIVPVLSSTPDEAEQILDTYTMWGSNLFALNWRTPNVRQALPALESLGFETTIYDVRSLEEFLQSVLHTPVAIVSNFNFPLWNSREYETSNDITRCRSV